MGEEPALLPHEHGRDRQAEAAAALPAADVGVVERALEVSGDALAVVQDLEAHPTRVVAHGQGDRAVGLARLDGVLDEVDEDLRDVIGVPEGAPPLGLDDRTQRHAARVGVGAQELHHVLRHRARVERRHLRRARAREVEELGQHAVEPLGLAQADLCHLVLRQVWRDRVGEDLDRALDASQRVADLVGQTSRQPHQAFEPRGVLLGGGALHDRLRHLLASAALAVDQRPGQPSDCEVEEQLRRLVDRARRVEVVRHEERVGDVEHRHQGRRRHRQAEAPGEGRPDDRQVVEPTQDLVVRLIVGVDRVVGGRDRCHRQRDRPPHQRGTAPLFIDRHRSPPLRNTASGSARSTPT